jgi:uncharacterized protein (DUF1501 family)
MKNSEHGKGLTRRQFVARTGVTAVSLPILLNGLPVKAFDGPSMQRLFNTEEASDRVLVLIQLNGGNDGLNTVIPLDRMNTYTTLRPNVAIKEKDALKIRTDVGLHPRMAEIKTLYEEEKVGIIQGVNYPNPNQSHFRSNDIWMSGSASNVSVSSGWLGRFFDTQFTGYPEGYPNEVMPDPIAIQLSAIVGLTLMGPEGRSMGMALQDPETFYQLISGTATPGDDLPSSAYARENVLYVREVQVKSLEYSEVIKAAADKADNLVQYPTPNRLADQLKIVSRLIAGGLKTRAYVVQLGGFDTHASQVDQDDPTSGAHANLLQQVSQAVMAFQRDLEAHGVDHRVAMMSFSEFGRRPYDNLSYGTDHGTAAPMFFFGTPVENGITGMNPDLEDLENQNLKIQYDFRQIYASVLQQWFLADPNDVKDVLYGTFETTKVIKGNITSVNDNIQQNGAVSLHPIAPNPVRDHATVTYEVKSATSVRLDVFDMLGFHVTTLIDASQDPDVYHVDLAASRLPSGTYMIRLAAGRHQVTQPMVVTR